jgi:hypothetical protein
MIAGKFAVPESPIAMTSANEDRIVGLWGTPFLHFTVKENDTHSAALAALATADPDLDILTRSEASALWIKAQIEATATAYFERWAEARVAAFSVTGRTLIHGHSDYQPLSNHPEAYLSGLYFVTAPAEMRDKHHRFDAESNALSFYDPRFAMNMGAIARDPNAELEKIVRPKPGVLIAWPSYIDYYVHPNLSAAPLIAIQFNVSPEAMA